MKMEMSGNKIMNPHRNGKQMEYFERRVRSWGLIALCALAIAVFFCFPFANGQLHQGADTGFHLNRIISLALARENGIRYPYLFCEQNYQFGYPTPIFYCNLFLSAPAALLQSGMPPVIVYKLLVVVLVWLAALFLPYLPARWAVPQPASLGDSNMPLGVCMVVAGLLFAATGVLTLPTAWYVTQYPYLFETYPLFAAWADAVLPLLAGVWLVVYGVRAMTGFGLARERLGSPAIAVVLPLCML